jgi:hypothetical protein
MTPPPNICPRPGSAPDPSGKSCPLWDARERIQFQRSIEADGAALADMSSLVRDDMNISYWRREGLPTRPTPITPGPLAVPSTPFVPIAKKGAPVHA